MEEKQTNKKRSDRSTTKIQQDKHWILQLYDQQLVLMMMIPKFHLSGLFLTAPSDLSGPLYRAFDPAINLLVLDALWHHEAELYSHPTPNTTTNLTSFMAAKSILQGSLQPPWPAGGKKEV